MGMIGDWIISGADERICSVTTGLVKNNWDDGHPGMVKVEYFLGTQGKNVTGWLPVAVPYAYDNCGMYMLPEIGSEVVVAFNMGDRNCPIAIGCLWNRKNKLMGDTAAEGNKIKRFKTKGGCEVVFEEEKGKEVIEVHTPADLKLRMEDENQTVAIQDKEKKNGVLIDAKEGSIKLFADKKITFEAGGKAMVVLDGSKKSLEVKADEVKGEAARSYTLKGQNVQLEGTQMDIKGKSQLSVQSGGMAQIKGASVKIN
ncbi:hypothetical protein D7V86_01555 [bacterium D16-51]|nr:hypothetical protein D7V96_00985 [bacterium D16-59]RKI62486.1 hypothetical protein D7V86_01555 [bacterium D16-51]